jgi:hypothetical protein
MASTKHWVPKVNRHARVLVQKTVTNFLTMGSNTNYAKRRPGTVTGFATDTNPRFRVRRSGEVYGSAGVGVVRQIDSTLPVGGDAAGETRLVVQPGPTNGPNRTGKYISQ